MSRNIKIVSDSSSDVVSLEGVSFASAPLKIITTDQEYVDDEKLDVTQMVDDLLKYKGKSSTSCPNTEDWIRSFGDAEEVFCVTITSTLSGSYNSACIAKEMYEKAHPNRKVFVLDTLSTGPEMKLIIDKIQSLILEGKTFEDICDAITHYRQSTGLFFMLESMKNLANNGRVSPIVAKIAGTLGIRLVGKASEQGDLQPLNKCIGEKKALDTIVTHLKNLGSKIKKINIAHCLNEKAAISLKERILKEFEKVKVEIYKCKGLCSFYAEKGGLLIGYEK